MCAAQPRLAEGADDNRRSGNDNRGRGNNNRGIINPPVNRPWTADGHAHGADLDAKDGGRLGGAAASSVLPIKPAVAARAKNVERYMGDTFLCFVWKTRFQPLR